MLYLSNFSPVTAQHTAPGAWSIETEAAFYLLLPLAFRYVRTPRVAATIVVLGELIRKAVLIRLHPNGAAWDYWSFMSLPANLVVFASGILVYLLWRDHLRTVQGTAQARA